MAAELGDALVQTWVTGWARTRDYEARHEGNVHSARLRTETETEDWEYVIYNPSW